jgi:hypothetical protein
MHVIIAEGSTEVYTKSVYGDENSRDAVEIGPMVTAREKKSTQNKRIFILQKECHREKKMTSNRKETIYGTFTKTERASAATAEEAEACTGADTTGKEEEQCLYPEIL